MLIRYYAKNAALIIAITVIIITFGKAQDFVYHHFWWIIILTFVFLVISYVVDLFSEYFWLKYSDDGKIYKAVKEEREMEARQFGNDILEANKIGSMTGNWSKYIALTDKKTNQVWKQNVMLLNRWLKSQLGDRK